MLTSRSCIALRTTARYRERASSSPACAASTSAFTRPRLSSGQLIADPIRSGCNLRFPRGDRGQRGAELRLRTLGIERASPPRLEPLVRDLERAALVLGVVARDAELLLRASQLEIRQRQLSGEGDLHVAQLLLRGAYHRTARLSGLADLSEDIQVPRRSNACVPDVLIRERPGKAGEGRAGEPLPCITPSE